MRAVRIRSAVTRHRFGGLDDSSAKRGRVQRQWVESGTPRWVSLLGIERFQRVVRRPWENPADVDREILVRFSRYTGLANEPAEKPPGPSHSWNPRAGSLM